MKILTNLIFFTSIFIGLSSGVLYGVGKENVINKDRNGSNSKLNTVETLVTTLTSGTVLLYGVTEFLKNKDKQETNKNIKDTMTKQSNIEKDFKLLENLKSKESEEFDKKINALTEKTKTSTAELDKVIAERKKTESYVDSTAPVGTMDHGMGMGLQDGHVGRIGPGMIGPGMQRSGDLGTFLFNTGYQDVMDEVPYQDVMDEFPYQDMYENYSEDGMNQNDQHLNYSQDGDLQNYQSPNVHVRRQQQSSQ